MMMEVTVSKLNQMKLAGMAESFIEQIQSTLYSNLPFEEHLGLLVDREMVMRDNRRLANFLRGARLRYPQTCCEEIDFRTSRGLARDVIVSLMQNGWVKGKQNVIITGPTGCGKTFIACALAPYNHRVFPNLLHTYSVPSLLGPQKILLERESFAERDLKIAIVRQSNFIRHQRNLIDPLYLPDQSQLLRANAVGKPYRKI